VDDTDAADAKRVSSESSAFIASNEIKSH